MAALNSKNLGPNNVLKSNVLMDRSLSKKFIGLLYDWFGKCFVCVHWCKAYSCWFQILAGVRQGGILSPVLFAVYIYGKA